MFELFAQAERTYSRSQGGLGIGLTLVRSSSSCTAAPSRRAAPARDQGSEFIVRLPLLQSPAVESPRRTEPAREHAIAAQRILVVDDNIDAAESLGAAAALPRRRRVDGARRPAALEAVRIHKPSAAVLDIGMPGMDGFELARRARAAPDGAELTLIALTGWGHEDDRRRSRKPPASITTS